MAAPMRKDEARLAATEARLAALSVPAGGFTGPARADALKRLQAMGLPGRRDEYWKFTNPTELNAVEAATAEVFVNDEPEIFGAVDRVRLVFVDGVFDAAASDDPAMAGVEITRLATAGAADIHWAKDLYGTLEARGQVPVARPFATLNTASATR